MSGREQSGFQEVVNLLSNIVTVATAPGIIVHEFGHYAAARHLGATVQEVTFFQLEDRLFDHHIR